MKFFIAQVARAWRSAWRMASENHEATPDARGPVEGADGEDQVARRDFLTSASAVGMGACLVAGYGTFAAMGVRYLFPSDAHSKVWHFVCTLDRLAKGEALEFTTPTGARVNVARIADGETVDAFLALSSVCPHLGCRVHWESQNDRFFCPCHNGAFDRQGAPTEGPPKDGNQSLPRYPLRIEGRLLLIEVAVESIVSHSDDASVLAANAPNSPEGA
jgi:cytochrome b6-f complex iron-sulfur subunit